ncbi:MAG: acyl-CoA dehydrogenase domain protein [Marmoricola sp.]|jgi:alkylation response protein AidB-like acyl-CoA dehydrogenase|nr:acyl-CoA dehydrogenase domain protein [Marmoricola sp.]
MDFDFTPEQVDATELAATIFTDACTPERLKAIDGETGRFDRELWSTLGKAGLLGLAVPEAYDGGGLGLLELCSVLVEAGRVVAPVPLVVHAPTAMAIAEFGTDAQKSDWLTHAATGEVVLSTAISEERNALPDRPTTRAELAGDSWTLTGTKVAVPAGTVADLFVVPADTADGVKVFLVRPSEEGVTVSAQRISDGDEVARLELDGVVVSADQELGTGREVVEWLQQRLVVALCAQQVGTLDGALKLTSAYARTREQFGRPIGTFQAVSQRLADGYIDVLGTQLALWQAAWRLDEGLPAGVEVASAKVWAADAGHKLAHTTVHVHGGNGIDLDGEAHRYFTAAKRNEFTYGGVTEHSLRIGRALAAEPA